MKRNKKGQAAVEFIIYFAFIMLMFSLFVAFFARDQLIEFEQRDYNLKGAVVQRVSETINIGVRLGDGFNYTSKSLEYYGLENVSIEIDGNAGFVRGSWANGTKIALSTLSTSNVSASGFGAEQNYVRSDGVKIIELSLANQCLKISNQKGTIWLSQPFIC